VLHPLSSKIFSAHNCTHASKCDVELRRYCRCMKVALLKKWQWFCLHSLHHTWQAKYWGYRNETSRWIRWYIVDGLIKLVAHTILQILILMLVWSKYVHKFLLRGSQIPKFLFWQCWKHGIQECNMMAVVC